MKSGFNSVIDLGEYLAFYFTVGMIQLGVAVFAYICVTTN